MYVCMSVRYGFTIEIYGFMHSLRTSLARATHDAIAVKVEDLRIEDGDSEDRSRRQNKSRDIEDGQLLNKRMKDNKITVDLRVSTLLRSLTYERDRWRTARHCLDSASSFAISFDRTFHMLGVRQMMRMHIPTVSLVDAPQGKF